MPDDHGYIVLDKSWRQAYSAINRKWCDVIPIKIQCGCGQRYAFEVESAAELAPNSVACPVCGMDGTAAANLAIVQNPSAQAAVTASAASPRMRLSVSTPSAPSAPASTPPAPAPRRLGAGQMEPAQAQHEARAKILWGDSPDSVTGFLLMQGFSHEEASNLVRAIFRERVATVRATGIRKIFLGSGLVALPVVTTIVFLRIGIINLWIWAFTIITGLSGLWMVLNGILMVVAPKSQAGDASDND